MAITTFRGLSLILFPIAVADLVMGYTAEGVGLLIAAYALAHIAEGCVYLLDESLSNPSLKIT